MTKRKASELDTEKSNLHPAKRSKRDFLAHCKRVLPRYIKKAKTFESQKVAKYIKKKQSEGTDAEQIKALEAELAAIKAIDVKNLLYIALTQCETTHPNVAAHLDKDKIPIPRIPESTDSVEHKANMRLLSHKLLREGMDILMPSNDPNRPNTLNKKRREKREAAERLKQEQEKAKPLSGDKDDAHVERQEQGSGSGSGSGTSSDSDSDLNVKKQPKKQKGKKPTTTSTFLPSLAVGFTAGESDAEDDVLFDLSDGEQDSGVRKNRRGQRARRAIWERKYGKEAKHLVLSQEADQMAQAAVDARKRARGIPVKPKQVSEDDTTTLPPKKEKEKPKADDEGPLHASWQAKKLALQKAGLGVNGGGFKGTKIRFDD